MTELNLINALNYYGVEDEEYLSVLKRDLITINNVPQKVSAFEDARSRYFTDDSAKRENRWGFPSLREMFGEDMPPFSVDLLLLSGWERHRDKMKLYNFPEEQVKINITHLHRLFSHYTHGKTILPPVQAKWGSLYINGQFMQIGRLQYQFENLDKSSDISLVKLHIPADGRLEKAAVDDSLRRAVPMIKKIYGVDKLKISCTSWLLSRQLDCCIDKDSNLGYFRSLFDVTDLTSCVSDVMGYVYGNHSGKIPPFETLPETTTLQRRIKDYLIAGGDILAGSGVISGIE